MTSVAPPASAAAAPPAATRNRRSRAEEAEIVRAKKTLAALPKLLPGIAAKDANAAKVRIDKAWVDQYSSIITAAETSADGRAVARVDMKAATAQERKSAAELAALLVDVRDRIATHTPDDVSAQQAYGRGSNINAKSTGALIGVAGSFLLAFDGQWKKVATDAGVTSAMMGQIQSLRDSLSSADMGQHGIITANADGTMQRAALFTVLRSMSTFAVKVVNNVFGKTSSQALSLSDPRPLTNRAAARKAETKLAKKAKRAAAATKKAAKPKKRAASVKRRAKSVAVKARAGALTAAAKPAANAKSAKKAAKKRR